ncbi:MAG: 4'-phosphopantetheinyl transferase superfamily protein [Planctomycetes bacterium]|nr:4'-phosphopantetheinyl transferase superfamily protein [Planctomycetota bacterium]
MNIFANITKQLSSKHIIFFSTLDEKQLSTLEPIERKYVENSSLSRQKEFATGRWCAKQAMLKLGIGTNMILMGPNNEPVWRNDITGSITHTDKAFCAAVTDNKDLHSIGIDIEQRNRRISPHALALILNDDEKAWIAQTGKRRWFYENLVFSAKESIYKMISSVINKEFFFDSVSIYQPISKQSWLLLWSSRLSEMKSKLAFYRRSGVLTAELKKDLGSGFEATSRFDVYYFFDRKWIVTAAFN